MRVGTEASCIQETVDEALRDPERTSGLSSNFLKRTMAGVYLAPYCSAHEVSLVWKKLNFSETAGFEATSRKTSLYSLLLRSPKKTIASFELSTFD
jgi:hypothetical protein